jgi:hypothetical protein
MRKVKSLLACGCPERPAEKDETLKDDVACPHIGGMMERKGTENRLLQAEGTHGVDGGGTIGRDEAG